MEASSRSWTTDMRSWLILVGAIALILVVTAIAATQTGEPLESPYAPYIAGPVIHGQAIEPYAPYTAGPVVQEVERPYAPYTAGPVIHEEVEPYAPYTAGPVVPEVGK